MAPTTFDKAFLGFGSLAAGAAISAAAAAILIAAVPETVPVIGAVLGLGATILSGAFQQRAVPVSKPDDDVALIP